MADGQQKIKDRINSLDVGQSTRAAALLALALSIFSTIVACWLVYAIWWNITELKRAGVVPKLDANFDAVAAAAAVGRLDVLAMVLAFMAAISGLALVYGFTAFRAAATRAAIEEVDRRLPGDLAERMAKDGHLLLAVALDDGELVARLQARFTSFGIDDTEAEGSAVIDSEPDWKEDSDVRDRPPPPGISK